jgi:hypothetical protein
MSQHVILKPKHSLIGKNLIPIVLRLKAQGEEPPLLARLKREHPLENYSIEELLTEFGRLCGERADDTMSVAGRDVKDIADVRLTVHFAILHANVAGPPKGQLFSSTTGVYLGVNVFKLHTLGVDVVKCVGDHGQLSNHGFIVYAVGCQETAAASLGHVVRRNFIIF